MPIAVFLLVLCLLEWLFFLASTFMKVKIAFLILPAELAMALSQQASARTLSLQ